MLIVDEDRIHSGFLGCQKISSLLITPFSPNLCKLADFLQLNYSVVLITLTTRLANL